MIPWIIHSLPHVPTMFPTWRLGRVLQIASLRPRTFSHWPAMRAAPTFRWWFGSVGHWLGPSNSSPESIQNPPCESWLLVCQSVEVQSSSENLAKWRRGQFLKASCATVQAHEEWSNSKFTAYNFATQPSNSLRYISHLAALEICTFN